MFAYCVTIHCREVVRGYSDPSIRESGAVCPGHGENGCIAIFVVSRAMDRRRSKESLTATEQDTHCVAPDRIDRLGYADRWLRDGLRVATRGDFFVSTIVDMSQCNQLISGLREKGVHATFTHVVIRAVAIALSRNPALHHLISERIRLRPARIDIGLSIAANTVLAPVLVIENVLGKNVMEIAQEVVDRAPEIRRRHQEFLSFAAKWGWLVPLGGLRRLILRILTRQLTFRRRAVGTFQVSCLRDVDQFVPFLFSTSAILGFGRVRDHAVAINGNLEVRPTATLSCCVDHKAWDGLQAAVFLREVAAVLENGELESGT